MPVSALIGAESLTPQTLATFALQADQERRAAIKRGDLDSAATWKRESDRLCDIIKGK